MEMTDQLYVLDALQQVPNGIGSWMGHRDTQNLVEKRKILFLESNPLIPIVARHFSDIATSANVGR
jgi:hypothetical protein